MKQNKIQRIIKGVSPKKKKMRERIMKGDAKSLMKFVWLAWQINDNVSCFEFVSVKYQVQDPKFNTRKGILGNFD